MIDTEPADAPAAAPADISAQEPEPADAPTAAGTAAEPTAAMLDLALAAAVADAEDEAQVGAFASAAVEDAAAVTLRFAALVDGYRGWMWSVTLGLVDPDRPTVSEVVLLPGPEALLAPEWVPWQQRVLPSDLGVGDLLPVAPDDERLAPAYLASDDPAVEEVAHELGIGRDQVMSRLGRADAADRWHGGPFGPGAQMAKQAPAHCATCAFYLPLAGSLGAGFGVCGNQFSPADGRVVDLGFGCGAHSAVAPKGPARSAAADAVVDELVLEVHRREDAEPEPAAAAEPPEGSAIEPAGEQVEELVEDPVAEQVEEQVGAGGADGDESMTSR